MGFYQKFLAFSPEKIRDSHVEKDEIRLQAAARRNPRAYMGKASRRLGSGVGVHIQPLSVLEAVIAARYHCRIVGAEQQRRIKSFSPSLSTAASNPARKTELAATPPPTRWNRRPNVKPRRSSSHQHIDDGSLESLPPSPRDRSPCRQLSPW